MTAPFSKNDIKRLASELEGLAGEYDPPKSMGAVSEHAAMIRRAAAAFRAFVSGQQLSLDEAFGIEKSDQRATEKLDSERWELVRDAYEIRYLNGSEVLTWPDIAHELNCLETHGIDWRRLCTMVREQRERLKAYFEEDLPRHQLVRDLEKEATSRAVLKARRKRVRVKEK